MATSTDYKFALYNENGVDLVRQNMFYPKLIGTMTLRQKALGELFVVAADGTELDSGDGSRNRPLSELRGEGLRNWGIGGSGGGWGPLESPSEYRTSMTHKYQFSLYGSDYSLPLLASVIHGWGDARNDIKLEMAHLLVSSVISGQDYKFAQMYAQQGRVPPEWRYLTGDYQLNEGLLTGLPCTVTFRCRKTGGGELSGFGQVSVLHGLLYVEMTPYTEIELHFYDLVGIPWEYFQKCSTVRQPEGYGVVGYSYDPPMTNYAIPMPAGPVTDPTDPAHSYETTSGPGLEIGPMVRGRWMFLPDGTSPPLYALQQALVQDDARTKSRLTLFLEGDASATLRYETFNSARPYLRLLSNQGALKKGDQITVVKPDTAHGALYTVRGGHNYAKVCSMLQHTCGGLMQLTGGGLMNATGGAENYSFWGKHISNRPAAVRPGLHIPDDYNGAPWNSTVRVKVSDMLAQIGISGHGASSGNTAEFLLREPTSLERFNMWLQTHLPWAASIFQTAAAAVSSGGPPTYANIPNPDYDPKLAQKREHQLRRHHQMVAHEAAMAALRNGEMLPEYTTLDNAEMQQMENELNARRSLLEMIEAVTDGTETHHAYYVPFWGMPAFRHSDDKLEVYQPITWLNGRPIVQPPEYVPENWILCRTPV